MLPHLITQKSILHSPYQEDVTGSLKLAVLRKEEEQRFLPGLCDIRAGGWVGGTTHSCALRQSLKTSSTSLMLKKEIK